ncbi:MAG TPA: hypothetical protein VFN53_00195 [Acidobacteriaceae bacterium]|nr:hypothetical protein [Acidobacteriaceae bacterium]
MLRKVHPLAGLAFVFSAAAINALPNSPSTRCYPPLRMMTSSIPTTTAGSTYRVHLAANGGQPPDIWSFGRPSLPERFSIRSSGDLTGLPVAAGTYSFKAVVSDSLNNNLNRMLTLSVTPTSPRSTPTVIVVTPANVSIATGSSQQFAASVTGTSNTALTWSVSGTGCSGTACGTISPSGLYTAPPAVPSSTTITVTATSVWNPKQSASGTITILRPAGTTYYLAPASAGGNDSHNGLSATTPWLTPNHAVNCGDVIIAAPGNYSASNFEHTFGTVTCPTGNNVAWLKCAAFDTCKISAGGSYTNGMTISADYWGVQGWEITTTQDTNACFLAWPSSGVTIHHIIFANDIANGCYSDGFTGGYNGHASVDYLVVIGSIAYNAAQTRVFCASGITVGEAVESDPLPGTHIYFAGNFSWGNIDANPCGGGPPTDGNGIIIDTLDGSQVGYTTPYAAQVVVANNILVANGGRGVNVFDNSAGSQHARIYVAHNTLWGNNRDTNETGSIYCGESQINNALNVHELYDLAVTDASTGCSGIALYDYAVHEVNGSDHVYDDWGWSASGTYTSVTAPSTGFAFGPDNTFANPKFANPVAPGAPHCSGYSSVPACMAAVIADFKPTNPAAAEYGYQIPSSTAVDDPLFPQWLCSVTNLPPGLVTMGCLTGPASSRASKSGATVY